jgi:hypothetical protein
VVRREKNKMTPHIAIFSAAAVKCRVSLVDD